MRSIAIVVSVIALFPSAPATAQDDRPADAYWYCHSVQDESPIYVTAVWETKAVPTEVRAAFGRLLAQKYGYKKVVHCSIALKGAPASSLLKSQTDAKGQITYWRNQGKTVVETGWTDSQPSPAAVRWSVCRAAVVAAGGTAANGPYETYMSSAFAAGTASVPDLQARFKVFLMAKYNLKDANPTCGLADTESAAGSTLRLWMLDARRRGGKVIETGWTGSPIPGA